MPTDAVASTASIVSAREIERPEACSALLSRMMRSTIGDPPDPVGGATGSVGASVIGSTLAHVGLGT
jgi:hypothetical protein